MRISYSRKINSHDTLVPQELQLTEQCPSLKQSSSSYLPLHPYFTSFTQKCGHTLTDK